MTLDAPPQTIRIATAPGVALTGDLSGPESGPFVLMTHGGGQTRHSWGTTARTLAAKGYRVLSLDLRGHGDSDWSAEGQYSVHDHGRDVAMAAASAPGPVMLVGASMGGLASLMAAANLGPQKVSGVVLVDVATRVRADGTARILGFMNRHAGGFDTLEAAADAISDYRPEHPRPRDLSGLSKNLRMRDSRYYWHWDPAMLTQARPDGEVIPVTDLEAAARAISAPVLLVRGLLSDVVDADSVTALQALIPQLETADVRDAGHMVVGDNNAAFETLIIGFLDRVLGLRPD